jgi:hypothetical protein
MKPETKRRPVLAGNSDHVSDQLLELSRMAAAIAVAVNGLEDVPDGEAQIGIRDLAFTLKDDLEAISARCGNAMAPMDD